LFDAFMTVKVEAIPIVQGEKLSSSSLAKRNPK